MSWFEPRKEKAAIPPAKALWAVCAKCKSHFPKAEWKAAGGICPKCGYHGRLSVRDRIAATADEGTFKELFREVSYSDHLSFHDAAGDLDGDGFTNIEEYTAKTDLKDPASHPDYLDFVKVQLPLQQTFTHIEFQRADKLPDGRIKFSFKDPAKIGDYDRGIYSVRAGEDIGKSGFVAVSYEQKAKQVTMGGGMKRSVDVSEATVKVKSSGKTLKLVIGKTKTPVDVKASLVYTHDETANFSVAAGEEIEIHGTKYVIMAIESRGKGASVRIKDKATGKTRTIETLE